MKNVDLIHLTGGVLMLAPFVLLILRFTVFFR